MRAALASAALCGAAAGCAPPSTCEPPAATYSRVLPVRPRVEWGDGFSGALSVQTAALAHGAWISQGLVRKAATHGEGRGNRLAGFEVLPTNVAQTALNLKLQYDEWDFDRPRPQAQAYKGWLKRHLARGHPVVWFVMEDGGGAQTPYRGATPNGGRFSRAEPVWGVYSNRSLDDPAVHDDDVLVHGSAEGTDSYYRRFGSLADTPALTGNCAAAPPGGAYPCIYDQVDYGLAVTGLAGEGLHVGLAVDRPDEPDTRRPLVRPASLHGTVTVAGLSPGREYVIYRYNSTAHFPSAPESRVTFTAAAAEHVYADPAPFPSDGATYYRAAPAPPAPRAPRGAAAAPRGPRRLAVLGTGLGAMSAVYYLTNYEGWEADWDIDVYQLGWRAGGKAASGRTMDDATGSRTLEHGLHMFFAGYSNAVKWMKDMYAEWDQPASYPIRTFADAIKPSCNSDLYVHLNETVARQKGLSPWQIIGQKDPMSKGWECAYTKPNASHGELRGAPTPWATLSALVARTTRAFRGAPAAYAGAAARVVAARAACGGPPGGAPRAALLSALRALQATARARLAAVEASADVGSWPGQVWPPPGWCSAPYYACSVFFWRATFLELTVAVGLIADDIVRLGGGAQGGAESMQVWLCRHGDCDGLPRDDLPRALFSAAFGYADGDFTRPNIGLGVGGMSVGSLFSGLMAPPAEAGAGEEGLTLNYAVVNRFQAGMGEVIMTPAYEVLRRRGVRFHFFHKVEQLRSADGTNVDAIDITVQATVRKGETEYDPLMTVQGIRVWPDLSTPAKCDGCGRFFDQLNEGAEIREKNVNLESFFSGWRGAGKKTLRFGEDYDVVLNGITSGALPHVTEDLRLRNGEWAAFVDTTKTVATIGLQIWTYNTTEELGYVVPDMDPGQQSRWELLASAGPDPYDTVADMSHLIKYETANASANGGAPRSVQYWCSPIELDTGALDFSNASFPAAQMERAYTAGVWWLENHAREIYPKWADRLYESMVAPPGAVGRDRLRHQYWRTNFEPPEQYVLTVAGSEGYRPTPFPFRDQHAGKQPFANMALAGDHTANGINMGCAEAAVTSGCMAARGLSGRKTPDRFVDYESAAHSLTELADPSQLPLLEAE